MGQKVHPLGIRKGIPSHIQGNYLNSRTQKEEGLLDHKSLIDYGANLQKGIFAERLHQNLLIEEHLQELFQKSGFILVNTKIKESSEKVYLYLDLFHRAGTSESPLFQKEKASFPRRVKSKRYLSWTPRRSLQWRNLQEKDFAFYGRFFQKFLTKGSSVVWKIRLLEDQTSNHDLRGLQSLFRFIERQAYYRDLLRILPLVSQEPSARLLAQFMALELKETHRHQHFIDMVAAGLEERMDQESSQLLGCLLQVKGRINGSDRSKRAVFRKGSMPLQTLKAGIDYGFAEVVTKYGVCGIKVWLRYK